MKPMFPPEFPEVRDKPELKLFLANINKSFMELRRLIVDNYTVATCDLLLDVLSGISVLFYDVDPKDPKTNLEERGNRGNKFKTLLAEIYPWDGELENITREEVIELLYTWVRNPISHSLGMKYPYKQLIVLGLDQNIDLEKGKELEESTARPSWAHSTATKDSAGVPAICLSTLYYGFTIFAQTCTLPSKQTR
jgi:hypothetical protein